MGLGNATLRCVLQCNVGTKSPVFLCVLQPEKVDSCELNVEFEEADDVIFSVIGPRSIHLTGFFLARPNSLRLNDDESYPLIDFTFDCMHLDCLYSLT